MGQKRFRDGLRAKGNPPKRRCLAILGDLFGRSGGAQTRDQMVPKVSRTCDLGVFKLHTVLSAREIMLFRGLSYAVSVASAARYGQLCGRKMSRIKRQNRRDLKLFCIVTPAKRKVNRFAGFSRRRICDGIIKEKGTDTDLRPAKNNICFSIAPAVYQKTEPIRDSIYYIVAPRHCLCRP